MGAGGSSSWVCATECLDMSQIQSMLNNTEVETFSSEMEKSINLSISRCLCAVRLLSSNLYTLILEDTHKSLTLRRS